MRNQGDTLEKLAAEVYGEDGDSGPSKLTGIINKVFGHGDYYYIVTTVNGKLYLLGPYTTEEKALDVADEEVDTEFEIIGLPTRNRTKATQMVRARVLDQTHNITHSVERMKHTMPRKRS